MRRPSVTVSEFARIIGVDHAAVFRAIKRGVRLQNSVVVEDGKQRIVIYDGCLEWHLNKDLRKDRTQTETSSQLVDGEIMQPSEALKLQRHFDAMTSMLTFTREAGNLVPKDAHRTEVFTYARGVRDSLLFLPLSSEHELKRLLFSFLRTHMEEANIGALHPEIDALAHSFRLHLRDAISGTLGKLADANLDGDRGEVDLAN